MLVWGKNGVGCVDEKKEKRGKLSLPLLPLSGDGWRTRGEPLEIPALSGGKVKHRNHQSDKQFIIGWMDFPNNSSTGWMDFRNNSSTSSLSNSSSTGGWSNNSSTGWMDFPNNSSIGWMNLANNLPSSSSTGWMDFPNNSSTGWMDLVICQPVGWAYQTVHQPVYGQTIHRPVEWTFQAIHQQFG